MVCSPASGACHVAQGQSTRATTPRAVAIRARETTQADLEAPAVDNRGITVTARGFNVREQVHFETDEARILPDSDTLLERIADVMNRHPEAAAVEIQGHTDNVGSRPAQLGAAPGACRSRAPTLGRTRCFARPSGRPAGYGAGRPIAPNITPAGRARNRRVMLITERVPVTR